MINPLKDIFGLFFPPSCPVCGGRMAYSGMLMCAECAYEIPLTGFTHRSDNPMTEKLWGRVPFVNACAYFWFIDESGYRRMIHSFKYFGGWRFAERLGEWFGGDMEDGGLYGSVDVVVPVPLHFVRRVSRGYNQSEYIARGIAGKINRPLSTGNVIRHKYNKAQARKHHSDRWDNVEGIFKVRHPERLRGKHILLVDDVFTTGATIISCAETILRDIPECRISIATLAVSKSSLNRKK